MLVVEVGTVSLHAIRRVAMQVVDESYHFWSSCRTMGSSSFRIEVAHTHCCLRSSPRPRVVPTSWCSLFLGVFLPPLHCSPPPPFATIKYRTKLLSVNSYKLIFINGIINCFHPKSTERQHMRHKALTVAWLFCLVNVICWEWVRGTCVNHKNTKTKGGMLKWAN
jgi:hypothetical protein